VQPAGVHKVLDSTVHAGAMTQRNRPAIAQTFKLLAGERPGAQHFTIVAAQLRDRSSGCGTDGGPQDGDRLDGQGECNLTRLSMARTLMDWLSTNPTADPTPADNRRFLIVGDFNAYLSEDPVEALTNRAFTAGASAVFPGGLAASSRATYIHLGRALMPQPAYSHAIAGQSGELDHGLANPALYRAVSGVARWKINADEPVVFDYNLDFSSNGSPVLRSQGQLTSYYSPGPTRSADRDPLVVDFNPLCGDVNDDGDVDNTDGALVRNAIGSTPVNRRYDLDLDRQVTMDDFRIVQACLAEARSAK
jgi:predicted extracellular nuclease